MDKHIQTLFGHDKSLFLLYYKNSDMHIKYGFDTLEDMWAANPEVIMS